MIRRAGLLALLAAGCQAQPSGAVVDSGLPRLVDAARPKLVDAAPPRPPLDAAAPKRPDAGAAQAPPLEPGTPAQIEALTAGKEALAAGRDAEARKQFLKAADGPVTGASVSAALAAAELLEASGDAAGAEALYVKLRGGPGALPEVHLAAARFYDRRGDVTRAVEAYKAAIHGQPDLLPAYSSLGVALARAGRNDEAAPVLLEYETRLNDVLRRFHDAKVSLGDRLAIVDLLATVSDERVTKVLIDALKDPDARMRMAAGNVLGDDDSAEALLALAQATPVESDAVAKRVLFEALRRARDRAHASEPKPQMPGPKKR